MTDLTLAAALARIAEQEREIASLRAIANEHADTIDRLEEALERARAVIDAALKVAP